MGWFLKATIQRSLTGDPTQDRFQTQLINSLQPIIATPMNYGQLLQVTTTDNSGNKTTSTQIALKSGAVNYFAHNLSRTPQGYMIVRQRGQARIWDTWDAQLVAPLSTQYPLSQFISLNTDTNVTVNVWVY